ncbi:TATA-binding protein-associated factor 172 isoform X2 [Procambarus clarkii]|uniref:TATA-binding protein-associated factor 172 isoform X2 n=1 Tax=Procambarus clarkii TaxID=6728 RepID=UPI003742F9AC
MSSRLDRLFLLLENGGSGVTRQAAAQQLGEVVRLHPYELNSLLNRVHTYLSSKSWDVRIAAGLAVEAIVRNVPQWNPQPLQGEREFQEEDYTKPRLSLGAFNLAHVLQKGSYLMAADEKLFEAEDENMPLNPADRLACQRRLVNQRLGLDIAEAMGINTESIFTNEDLAESQVEEMTPVNGQGKDSVMSIVKREMKSAGLVLSSRELNRARRKAKLLAKQKSVDVSECTTDEGPEKKRVRMASVVSMEQAGSDDDERMVVDEGPVGLNICDEGCEWPLENLCDTLATDLFCLAWETRHGAATALRQIIRVHGEGGGKTTCQTKEQMEQSHQAWLEDMAVRLMCVLALDRFGDFVSDQVVAPVRETCAQALGSILVLLKEDGVYSALALLETMLSWREWEARHGGLLGLKYLLAVRDDLRARLFTHTYPHIYRGLLDEMDDVVAVAASCLVPVADSVVELLDKQLVMKLVATLWDALLDIDDLTSSTNSILMLLAKLLGHLGNSDSVTSNLSELVPRLWPFLYHSSSSVRGSALKTLDTLTAFNSLQNVSTNTVPSLNVNNKMSGNEVLQKDKSEQSEQILNTNIDIKIEDNSEMLGETESLNSKVEVENIQQKVKIEKENISNANEDDNMKLDTGKCVKLGSTKNGDIGILSPVTKVREDSQTQSTITKKELKMETKSVNNLQSTLTVKEEISIKSEEISIKSEEISIKSEEIDLENPLESKCLSETVSESTPSTEAGAKTTGETSCFWLNSIIQPALSHVYQRALLEKSADNLNMVFKIWQQMVGSVPLEALLPAVCPMVSSWLFLTMTNCKVPLDASLLLLAHHHKSGEGRRLRGTAQSDPADRPEIKFYLGGCDQSSDALEKQEVTVRAVCAATKLLGCLSQYVIKPMPGVEYPPEETPDLCYVRLLIAHLSSRSAVQRLGAGAVVREWASICPEQECHPQLQSVLHTCLTEVVYYDEIALSFTRLQQETRDFMAMLRHYKLPLDESFASAPVLTLEQIQNLSGHVALTLFSGGRLRPKVHSTLEERRKAIQSSVSQTSTDQITLATTTQAIISGAVVRFKILPPKLNPVIKPLMDSIKKEKNQQLQTLAAEDLSKLLELCVDRSTSPNGKVIKNLASFLCVDQEYTPKIKQQESDKSGTSSTAGSKKGVLSLSSQLKNAERQLLRRSASVSGRGPGRPPGRPPANAKREDPAEVTEAIIENENQQLAAIQRRGCTVALQCITNYFGKDLPQKIPQLWDLICNPFKSGVDSDPALEMAQEAVNWLQLLEVVVPALHSHLVSQLESKLPLLEHWLYHPFCAVRHMASRVMGALACVLTVPTMSHVVEKVVPCLGAIDDDSKRQGAVECIFAVIDCLGFNVVPYIVLLIVPLLGRMSDQDCSVRLMATHCFATLIRLLPLEGGVPDPPSLSEELLQQKIREREFLEKLLDPTKIENYKVPVPIYAELRAYQQNGVNWLAFLNRYKLHGILCDDMGLGKTLQSICILAGDHYTKEEERQKSGCKGTTFQSLVVCPPTLTGHWVYEVQKFVHRKYLNPLHYTGPPNDRYRLRFLFPRHNLIVASYDIVRNDIDFFSKIKWNYVILDEGHIIKNGKTKSSKAIKQLVAHHRLILSGTPIQNNVLELWSLFDFLMPGFLGTERQFMARYSKPILQSRDTKSSSKEQEAGVLAMEALHRQALPFLLRRMKEDVLKDLPPKITQDYYCELSPLQEELYEDFARTQASQNISESLRSSENGQDEQAPKKHGHIFQALQYLRKVCNHPKLVLKPRHPEYSRISAKLKNCNSTLSDISHSAKLPALKQLLVDCGIGVGGGLAAEAVVSQHRALIFCQLKAMLDIIENDLLKAHLPTVTYLRLDGSVPAGSRHALVQRFNSDPSIDLLLLTTQVGGLGLNLIGADTVIFVEHDWNPMRDLQAMDRAHRIGQKRVVNVYRLITRGTLEEKIMGLQKFKVMTANTVISQENSSLLSMGTDQLLDLFTLDYGKVDGSQDSVNASGRSSTSSQALGVGTTGAKAALENLPELWDQDQYENEYDLDSFIVSLKK